MRALLPAARRALERSTDVTRVMFVDNNPQRVAELDVAMNEVLGRSKVTLPKKDLIASLRSDIKATIDQFAASHPVSDTLLFDEMRHVLGRESARSFEIG